MIKGLRKIVDGSEVSREDLLKEMHALREHLDCLEKTLEKA